MSDQMYLCGSGLFSSCLADTMSAFVEYKVNVGGCVPESFLPVLKRFDRYLAGCLGKTSASMPTQSLGSWKARM